jgi:hypothetical protein
MATNDVSDADYSPLTGPPTPRNRPDSPTPSRDPRPSRGPSSRDNSSRFDD